MFAWNPEFDTNQFCNIYLLNNRKVKWTDPLPDVSFGNYQTKRSVARVGSMGRPTGIVA